MPEPRVYITEDATTGITEAIDAIDASINSIIATLSGIREKVLAQTNTVIESAVNTQASLWNSQTALTDRYGRTHKGTLDTAYDDPAEDLEALASKAYSSAKPIFRSSPKTNQAQSYRKHLAQNRFFAHDGLFIDPSARVFPWHNSVANQRKFALQTAAEKETWKDFFTQP